MAESFKADVAAGARSQSKHGSSNRSTKRSLDNGYAPKIAWTTGARQTTVIVIVREVDKSPCKVGQHLRNNYKPEAKQTRGVA